MSAADRIAPERSGKTPALTVEIILEDDAWSRDIPEVEARIREAAMLVWRTQNSGSYRKNEDAELSVLLADNARLQDLNRTYREVDRATNVLAFPGEEQSPSSELCRTVLLGDIAIAYGVTIEEATAQKISPADHLIHLLIHGFLHLLGYDHQEATEAKEMEALEGKFLAELNIQNPYRMALETEAQKRGSTGDRAETDEEISA